MKRQSGFTLIELMVVMAIIAILATAGLTAYSNYLKKARDSARAQTARAIMVKVEELANGGNIPTVEQLRNFMIAENFASTTTSNNSGLELFNIEPLGGQGVCMSGLCGFMYITLTGNNYLIGYGVEHVDSQQNVLQLWDPSLNSPLYQDGSDGIEDILVGGNFSYVSWWANFIGKSSEAFSEGYVESSSTPRVIEAQFISNYTLYQHS